MLYLPWIVATVIVVATIAWRILWRSTKADEASGKMSVKSSTSCPTMTFKELADYAGCGGSHDKIYVAVEGVVYDVSSAPALYGHTGAYGALAGYDASRALAKHSTDSCHFNGPIDDLSEPEHATLKRYSSLFSRKYPVVATVKLPEAAEWALSSPIQAAASSSKSAPACHVEFAGDVVDMNFTMERLEQEFSTSQRRLVALKSVVFDVSQDCELFGPGGRFESLTGVDASAALARNSLDKKFHNCTIRGLSYEELKTLEGFYRIFDERYKRAGALIDGPTSSLLVSSMPSSKNTSLHVAIEAGDLDIIINLIRNRQCDVDEICTRTGMTPLHKACEANQQETVKVLLQAGANPATTAALYGGATAYELATRFGDASLRQLFDEAAVA